MNTMDSESRCIRSYISHHMHPQTVCAGHPSVVPTNLRNLIGILYTVFSHFEFQNPVFFLVMVFVYCIEIFFSLTNLN